MVQTIIRKQCCKEGRGLRSHSLSPALPLEGCAALVSAFPSLRSRLCFLHDEIVIPTTQFSAGADDSLEALSDCLACVAAQDLPAPFQFSHPGDTYRVRWEEGAPLPVPVLKGHPHSRFRAPGLLAIHPKARLNNASHSCLAIAHRTENLN